jgi:alanyl-tRNA synthetase
MQLSPDEFRLLFFSEEGFERKKCPGCGSFFWTNNPEQGRCGDAPCVDYTFIGNPPTSKPYSFKEMREKFLTFFEKRGHEIINPYPVVARWRDDLMVTIASIIDFQPYVTDGVIPPPANPLVVSQPCIRFEDIDLVGLTAGRHLTIFEMGGHHAFNYLGGEQIYWKDQTVRFHQELITELGVSSELVTYKEGIWSGGGNAGFCVEPCVGGLEISTLVFMMYKVNGNNFEPMPIQVVDTGYGIDRWTWLSQGSPSAFHACYGPVLDKAFNWAGMRVDDAQLKEIAKYSYLIDLENKELEQRIIADKIGIDYESMIQLLNPIEGIYAGLDHTKALTFILSEGVVPSNSKEGYLARMLFRRGFRMLRRAGIEERLEDMVESQIDYWGRDFQQLHEMKDEILLMVNMELKKYMETLRRGRGLVKRFVETSKGIPVEQLIEFYDSHGLTPEDVEEVASQEGVIVQAPPDFYNLVAQRHMDEKKLEKKEDAFIDRVKDLPETKRLFYENQYQSEFEANVVDIVNNEYIVLDRTLFYAEGGGQISDKGYITTQLGKMEVLEVIDVDGVILHKTNEAIVNIGQRVKGIIDWDRRIALMRSHTSTHIVLGATRRVLGEHAWQAGASKGVTQSRLDISHNARITREEIEEIENLANMVVREGRPVTCRWMQRDQAEKKFGFRLYQGGAVPGKEIRIVDMGDWDAEACGGTHLRNTSEIGLIKIINTERVQDGIERLTYSTGPQALQEIQKREAILEKTSELLGSPLEKVSETVANQLKQIKELRSELDSIKQILSDHKVQSLLDELETLNGIKFVMFSDEVNTDTLIEIGNSLTDIESSIVAVMLSEMENRYVIKVGDEALNKGINARNLMKELSQFMGGGGGGSKFFAQGGGGNPNKFHEAKNILLEKIKSFEKN